MLEIRGGFVPKMVHFYAKSARDTFCRGREVQHALILDDNPDNLMLIKLALGTKGFDLHTSQSLDGAMQLIGAMDFDLAVLDIELPDGNGLDVAAAMRKKENTCTIMMVSANDDGNNIERASKLGVDAYIVKPFNLPQVLKLIEQHKAGDLKRRVALRVIR